MAPLGRLPYWQHLEYMTWNVSLIRATAKNFKDTVIVASVKDYAFLLDLISTQKGRFNWVKVEDQNNLPGNSDNKFGSFAGRQIRGFRKLLVDLMDRYFVLIYLGRNLRGRRCFGLVFDDPTQFALELYP